MAPGRAAGSHARNAGLGQSPDRGGSRPADVAGAGRGGRGDWTATEATLRAFLAAKPDDPLGLALHAAALRQLGEIDAARGEAARALACDPGLAEAQFESAAALAEAGDRDGAGRLWLLLIEQHPDSSLAGLARRNLQGLNAADIATSQ